MKRLETGLLLLERDHLQVLLTSYTPSKVLTGLVATLTDRRFTLRNITRCSTTGLQPMVIVGTLFHSRGSMRSMRQSHHEESQKSKPDVGSKRSVVFRL